MADPGEIAWAGGLWGLFRGDACCFLLWNLSDTRANIVTTMDDDAERDQAVIGLAPREMRSEEAGNRIRATVERAKLGNRRWTVHRAVPESNAGNDRESVRRDVLVDGWPKRSERGREIANWARTMVDGRMSLKSISSLWTVVGSGTAVAASSRVTSLTIRDYCAYFRKRQFPMILCHWNTDLIGTTVHAPDAPDGAPRAPRPTHHKPL